MGELRNEEHVETALAKLEAEVHRFNAQIDRLPEVNENRESGQDRQ